MDKKSKNANLAVIPQRQLVGFGFNGGASQVNLAPQEAVLDTRRDVPDAAVFQHNAVLNLAVFDEDVVVDTGKRPDVTVDHARIFVADDSASKSGAPPPSST